MIQMQSSKSASAGLRSQSRCRQVPVPQLRRTFSVSASASDGFESFQRRARDWAADAKLEERAASAGKQMESTIRNAVDSAQSAAQRTYTRLDSEYNIQDKVSTASRRVEESLRDADQEWGVRRKFRSSREYLKRNVPMWKNKARDFLSTPQGKVAAVVAVFMLVQLPIFWQIVNTLLLLWWASIPISLLMVGMAQQNEQKKMQAQQAARARKAANPFSDIFTQARSSTRPGRGQQGGGRKGQSDGPIIDADYTVIDPK